MLEKIGLPPKPSQRGNNWVVDATHCQGCSSHFTFINRKHHCRRCGGIFCNSCTQQRMVLRGQGDSPVRICEPCKKLEEAARFEMRHGHRNRAGRGGSKLALKYEDDALNKILGNDVKESVSSGRESTIDMLSSIERSTSSASCSNIQEVTPQHRGGEILRTLSGDSHINELTEMGSATPEELRQQALDEKKKYKILKAEGKSEEALRAFKRGKELERQAAALELHLRKIRKMAVSSININETHEIKDDPGESGRKNKHSIPTNKDKDDLGAELRQLGWSDVDLHDAEKKPASMSLEGELSTLLGEVSQKTSTEKGTHGIDKSQVIAHKKKALALKREGKLTEAKEELKRAKVLEKQIEEQEFLIDAEDSDEELSSLIRSMDVDKQDDFSIRNVPGPNFNFDHLLGTADDGLGSNFEVTDEDMDDPEISAALKSLGWTEDTNHPDNIEPQFVPVNKETLLSEIQSLKREALTENRAGNTLEAMELLKKAKLFERDLDSYDSHGIDLTAQNSDRAQNGSISPSAENSFIPNEVDAINVYGRKDTGSKLAPKSKLMIQKELLSLKKTALALRREGRLDEAEEELKKGKALEQQLEEMDTASQVKVTQTNFRNKHSADNFAALDVGYEEEDVTDQDMHDPSYLSVLKNLGWNDENNENVRCPPRGNDSTSVQSSESSVGEGHNGIQIVASRRSKGEIQRELLGLKRKSLALRRQGETEEAEEVLKMARHLEAQLEEMEVPKQEVPTEFNKHKKDEVVNFPLKNAADEVVRGVLLEEEIPSASSQKSSTRGLGSNDKVTHEKIEEIADASEGMVPQTNQSSLKQEIMAHKRKAVTLKREGKLAEAKEELRQAKLLEKSLEDENPKPSTNFSDVSSSKIASVGQKANNLSSAPKLSSRDRFKLQQESLSHKRQALKLRREGRMEEAEAEFELAKALETQLEDITTHDSSKSSVNAAESIDDVGIEDLLDPQLLSALKAIGLEDANILSHGPQRPEVASKIEKSSQERTQLEEQIKSEKVKAVSLKRSGKQGEAMDALRRAKVLEKKLNSLASQ